MFYNKDHLQKGLIITDNPSSKPILDFVSYSDAIVKIIKESHPNFTAGIIGEWGTGKTTLMNLIKNELEKDKENIISVWFDAWKYENEKEFALIPLLKTINYSINDDNNEKKRNLKEALKEAAIFTIGISNEVVSSIVTNYAGKELGGFFKKSLEDVTTKLVPRLKELKKLSEDDKNSIFYNGIQNIQDALNILRDDNSDFRVIIFIDDLDRCSEDKVLEILESMKIFLSLDGIIFILGINQTKIVELINSKYKTDKGEQYLKKFIQIPITLTEWNQDEVIKLIDNFLENDIINQGYKEIVRDNKEIIATSIEQNPREIKRFLNNLIISYEVFVKVQKIEDEEAKNVFLKQLLLVQILKSNWSDVYRSILTSNGKFLQALQNQIPLTKEKIEKFLLTDLKIESESKEILEKYKSNERLWNFFDQKNFGMLNIINDWNIFRRASKITEQFDKNLKYLIIERQNIDDISVKDDSFDIIRASESNIKVLSFNDVIVEQLADFNRSSISSARFNDVKLKRINFSESSIKQTTFNDVLVEQLADFNRASISSARFNDVKLNKLDCHEASIYSAIFKDVNVDQLADFNRASISSTNFNDVKLNQVNFRNATISSSTFNDVTVEQLADFNRASISSTNFNDVKLNILDCSEASIKDINLENVKIEQADFSFGTLNSVNFKNVTFNLTVINNANLHTVNIKNAVVMWSNLVNSIFRRINFENVNLIGANLTNCKFFDVSFENVNLIGANLTNGVIINALSYDGLKVNSKTNFLNAVIDDPKLIEYLHQNNCINIPDTINKKSTLHKTLKDKGLTDIDIDDAIKLSKLSE